MTLDPESLARLRELAEKATPGPWFVNDRGGGFYPVESPARSESLVKECCESWVEEDARFIADANPATVLALLDEVERLRKRLHTPCGGCPGCGSNDCPDKIDALQGEVERLRAEVVGLQSDVEKWRTKARCYGDMVHNCSEPFARAGYPIDGHQPDGSVGGIKRAADAMVQELDRLRAEIEKHLADVAAAAGEFKVPIPEVGDPVGVMLSANILLRRENEKLRAVVAGYQREKVCECDEKCVDMALRADLVAANDLVARLRAKCEERKKLMASPIVVIRLRAGIEVDRYETVHGCVHCRSLADKPHGPDCAWQRAMEDV